MKGNQISEIFSDYNWIQIDLEKIIDQGRI